MDKPTLPVVSSPDPPDSLDPSDCPHYQDHRCGIASALAEQDVVGFDLRACIACMKEDPPQAPNKVTASLALHTASDARSRSVLHVRLSDYIHAQVKAQGAGDWLARSLRILGFRGHGSCKCFEHAIYMNMQGVPWCRENMDTIVGWLKEAAEEQDMGWIFTHFGTRSLIRLALNRAESYEQKHGNMYNSRTKIS